jgi:hypothetical protein
LVALYDSFFECDRLLERTNYLAPIYDISIIGFEGGFGTEWMFEEVAQSVVESITDSVAEEAVQYVALSAAGSFLFPCVEGLKKIINS